MTVSIDVLDKLVYLQKKKHTNSLKDYRVRSHGKLEIIASKNRTLILEYKKLVHLSFINNFGI